MSASPMGQYGGLITTVNRSINDKYFHHPDPAGHTCVAAALDKAHILNDTKALGLRFVLIGGLSAPHAVLSVTTPDDGVWILDNLRPWPERKETLEALGYKFITG